MCWVGPACLARFIASLPPPALMQLPPACLISPAIFGPLFYSFLVWFCRCGGWLALGPRFMRRPPRPPCPPLRVTLAAGGFGGSRGRGGLTPCRRWLRRRRGQPSSPNAPHPPHAALVLGRKVPTRVGFGQGCGRCRDNVGMMIKSVNLCHISAQVQNFYYFCRRG